MLILGNFFVIIKYIKIILKPYVREWKSRQKLYIFNNLLIIKKLMMDNIDYYLE